MKTFDELDENINQTHVEILANCVCESFDLYTPIIKKIIRIAFKEVFNMEFDSYFREYCINKFNKI